MAYQVHQAPPLKIWSEITDKTVTPKNKFICFVRGHLNMVLTKFAQKFDEICAKRCKKCVHQKSPKRRNNFTCANGRGLYQLNRHRPRRTLQVLFWYASRIKIHHNWPSGDAIGTTFQHVRHLQMGHLCIKYKYFTTCSCQDFNCQTFLQWTPIIKLNT